MAVVASSGRMDEGEGEGEGEGDGMKVTAKEQSEVGVAKYAKPQGLRSERQRRNEAVGGALIFEIRSWTYCAPAPLTDAAFAATAVPLCADPSLLLVCCDEDASLLVASLRSLR